MRSKTVRGTSLVEVLTAASISVVVLVVGMATYLLGIETWLRGAARLDANEYSQRAVRDAASTLREAMSVTVDANGLGLSYRLPAKDGNGDYLQPIVWDNINRRIQLDANNNFVVTADNAPDHTICKNVILTDPLSPGGTQAYVIFTPGGGAITRSLTVMVVSQQGEYKGETVTSRSRETIFLRNIPQLTD